MQPVISSPDQAVNYALDTSGLYPNLCDHFVGLAYGKAHSGYASAKAHWAAIPDQYKHPGDSNAPVGALVFFSPGQYGHVAIVTGKTKSGEPIITTTHTQGGRPVEMPLSQAKGLGYSGWATPYFQGETAKLTTQNLDRATTKITTDTAGGYTGSGETPPKGQDTLSAQELAAQNGFNWDWVVAHKQVWQVFQDAITGDWMHMGDVGKAKFENALHETKWWKNNSSYARAAILAQQTGGKEWEDQVREAKSIVQDAAAKVGAVLDDKTLDIFAHSYLTDGWKDRPQFLQRALVGELDDEGFNTDHLNYDRGGPQKIITDLKALARANGVSFDDSYYTGAAKMVLGGIRSQDDYLAEIRNHAASLFPVFGKRIQAGENARDIASPYTARMQDVLGVSKDAVDLNDPLLKQALGGVGKDGQPTAMSLWDFETAMKQDDRYQYGPDAHNNVDRLIGRLGQMFGFGG